VHSNNVAQQVNSQNANLNFEQLVEELTKVLSEAKNEAKSTEEFNSLAAISEAKDAASNKDGSGVINALKKGGKFVADVASKFAASALVELIKSNTSFLS
jgi:hypothetical protein